MSSARIEVIDAGLAVAIQDLGRTGFRRLGVPLSGALDPALLALANALAGNDPGAAALEVPLVGPTLAVRSGTVRFALAGPIGATVQGAGEGSEASKPQVVAPWSTVTLGVGDVIKIGAVGKVDQAQRLALGYVAVSGGIGVPLVLGSRSTYARAALGGFNGRALAAGDELTCANATGDARGATPGGDSALELRGAAPFAHEGGPIRLVAGPQTENFEGVAFELLESEAFSVSRDSDRMGLRLSGPKLQHSALGPDIASDGVTPGAIQVPADGQPIVLMADCQTVGGYPKIATVIRADLPRLAHFRPGDFLRFRLVTLAEAGEARMALARRLAQWILRIAPFCASGSLDEAALYGCNLVSGMVRADASEDDAQ
ncbi:MAG: biotin-dependent carboxyltransferase family protein [Burkholderiales bacterium]